MRGSLSHTPSPSFGGECPGVYYHRLIRDGWRLVEDEASRELPRGQRFDRFERSLPHGFLLRKLAHAESPNTEGRGVYWDEHVLVHPDGSESHEPDWNWADLDGRRLVFAKHGTLYAATFDGAGHLHEPKALHDFGPMTFERVEAPYT